MWTTIETFSFENQTYETKMYIFPDGSKMIKVFCNNRPVNGYSYSVDFLTLYSLSKKPVDVIGDFQRMAREDVENKMWDKFLKARQGWIEQ